MFRTLRRPDVMIITLAAAGVLMVTMGIRQSMGLFISPMNSTTGMGITSISLALAVGQLTWGAIQPIAGAVADRYGPGRVLVAGLIILALGCALTPMIGSGFGLTVTIGLMASMGSGASSFSTLIGAAANRIPNESRGEASGVINAGGSFGQFVFAPVLQKLIQSIGWMGAMWAMAITALATLPLVWRLRGAPSPAHTSTTHPQQRLGAAVSEALNDRSYWLLNLGFFTCGFHIAFLVTHLPGEIDLCGLPPSVASWSLALIGLANIFGSIYAGSAISKYRSKYVLAMMYGSRVLLVAWYLMMPRTEWVFYVFAIGLGFTWLATVPPTASVVAKLFGTRYLATLFGLTLLSHQIGGFLGAWLGGIAISRFGDFTWMWYADMVLAAIAAIANLPIREQPLGSAARA
ncbi:MFS transporter [Paenalcaligenes niemegkensis]|uniref:MFS transporter n=1 Tax=Paenalcaligenes niemegkensis TaxID=2895469 RepID=UPI001EE99654|nr:MFS transporter [Paenalcaligenes niemegkensis]MCQ9616031.1 MFS transporter [Paenalcaligenes niemegkensis]